MNERNDGGPAFPVSTQGLDPEDRSYGHQDSAQTWQYPGMTLRDHFAGQALVGCFNFWVQVHAKGASIGDPNKEAITRLAYEYADAMLEARTI
jgi:hypothetical protein